MTRTLSACVLAFAAVYRADEPNPNKQEGAVRAYVLENVDRPKSVEFVRWGPHDLKAKLRAMAGRATAVLKPRTVKALNYPDGQFLKDIKVKPQGPLPLVRVRLRLDRGGGKELHDVIFAVRDGRVWPFATNEWGDSWLKDFPYYARGDRPRGQP